MRCWLLIVLRLLIIVDVLHITTIVRNTSKVNAEDSQLGRSQRDIGVRDRWEDRYVGKVQERLIPLAVNDLLAAPHNLQALLHDIHALICALTHHKDASEHLQEAVVGAGGRRGTTATGSARSHMSLSTSTRSPRILRHYRAKRIMS
jgi:hypothetical protein